MALNGVLLQEQENELTAHLLYGKLSESVRDKNNAQILAKISEDELEHYHLLKTFTRQDVRPNRLIIFLYFWIARILGLTFVVKLLERNEKSAIESYTDLGQSIPEIERIVHDELEHEDILINMINEERLQYLSSVVLGLNDALVELTGALAGYTLAFQNSRLIALTGLITGISASFSMAASEYLSTMQEKEERRTALKAAGYTGMTYLLTVIVLVIPFFLLGQPLVSILVTLCAAVFIILAFNYYISVAKDLPFKKRFLEMTAISLGVAALSFLVGLAVKSFIGIEI